MNEIPKVIINELESFVNDIEIQSDFVEQGTIDNCNELTIVHIWNDMGAMISLKSDIESDLKLIKNCSDKKFILELKSMLKVVNDRLQQLA